MAKIQKPDYVIPFTKTKEEAEAAYRNAVRHSLFAPSSLKNDTVVERFRGIYMPYWIYNFKIDGETKASGTIDHRKGNYIYHDHYSVTSDTHANYEGISFDASSSFADSLSGAIAPYDIKESQEFNEGYLAGFYADTSDIGKRVYQKEARDLVKSDAANRAARDGHYGLYGIDANDLVGAMTPDEEESKMGYFPVWFLSNRTGDRISYAVVNGQTGKVAADLPIAFSKYLIGSLVIAVPLFLMMNLALTITPTSAAIVTAILGIVAMIINGSQKKKVYVRENYLDDAGMQEVKKKIDGTARRAGVEENHTKVKEKTSVADVIWGILYVITFLVVSYMVGFYIGFVAAVGLSMLRDQFKKANNGGSTKVVRTQEVKAPFGSGIPAMIKPLIGILLAIGVAIVKPVSDLYYYGAILVAMALILWAFFDMVGYHNRLTTRPLPQFNKRGGDE